MREKFVICQRPAKPKSAAFGESKEACGPLCPWHARRRRGACALPAESATSEISRGDQPQASYVLKQLLPQATEPTSTALASNLPAIDDGPAMDSDGRSENRTQIAAGPQGPENATQAVAEQRSVKAEKRVPPKQKVARPLRNNQFGAYAQSMYQHAYRANAAGWAWSAATCS